MEDVAQNKKRMLAKLTKASFNLATKNILEDCDPKISQDEALKQCSEKWVSEAFRTQSAIRYLSMRADKLALQLEKVDQQLEFLKNN